MTERGQDANDMSLMQAGSRRDIGDNEVLGQVAATQQGEGARISSQQQDAAVAGSDVGARADKRGMDIGVKEQAIDTTYEPWIEGDAVVAKGTMGDAAVLGKGISDYFKPKPRAAGISPGGAPSGGHHSGLSPIRYGTAKTGSTGMGAGWT
jgi:hypothetical protein